MPTTLPLKLTQLSSSIMASFFATSRLSSKAKFVFPTLAAAGSAYLFSTMTSNTIKNESASIFKGDDQWVDLKVKAIKDASADSKIFTFEFPQPDAKSGLITASAILTKFVTPKGSNVVRPYTPISDVDATGEFELLVKKYETGKMSTHIHDLKVNDTLAFKGPIVKWKWQPNQFKELTLIAGGTGITPMHQLVHEILKNKDDKTKITLLYGSKSVSDILMKDVLDDLAKKAPEQFKVTYFVDSAPAKEVDQVKVGFITKDVLKDVLPGPSDDTHVFVCGPPPLYNAVSGNKVSPTDQGEVTGILADLGYNKSHVFKF